MTALFNRVGDRILSALLPNAKASAGCPKCWLNCYGGDYHVAYYSCYDDCHPEVKWCTVYYPGGSYTSWGSFCPC